MDAIGCKVIFPPVNARTRRIKGSVGTLLLLSLNTAGK